MDKVFCKFCGKEYLSKEQFQNDHTKCKYSMNGNDEE